jgi:2',3'-cyclic-nucleotide 2'-phosphodiesterase (5'-nucleotidase family)
MYQQTFRNSPIVWLDAGDWNDIPTAEGALKTKALLAGMDDIGYAAANVSERELAGGYEAFLALTSDAKFPLVSANLVFQRQKKPILPPYTIVTYEPKDYPILKKPLRIAIAGVTRFNPTFLKSAPPKDNVIVVNPVDELKKYVPEMRKKADQVIVLAAMSKDDAHLIAREVPGIDIILGGWGGLTSAVEEKEGTTSIFYTGSQGKWLSELRVYQGEGVTSLKSQLHYLNSAYPDEPTMKAKVDQALVAINTAGMRAAAQSAALPAGGAAAAAAASPDAPKTYLGSDACKTCHAVEHSIWTESKHAHAMQTLVEQHSDFNPECVGCHVVAYKKPGGFVDMNATPTLADVQCESCHGPGARHLANPGAPYGKAGKQSCAPCHTHDRSPSFEFSVYWPKIRHGE